MMSLGGEPSIEEDQNKLEPKGADEANLFMAIKSTPSLNKAFINVKKITNRTTSQFTQEQRDLPTGTSEIDTGFAKPANLNVVS